MTLAVIPDCEGSCLALIKITVPIFSVCLSLTVHTGHDWPYSWFQGTNSIISPWFLPVDVSEMLSAMNL